MLKMEKTEMYRETLHLKAYIKSIEVDLKRKDDLLKALTEELRQTQFPTLNSFRVNPSLIPQEIQALSFYPPAQS